MESAHGEPAEESATNFALEANKFTSYWPVVYIKSTPPTATSTAATDDTWTRPASLEGGAAAGELAAGGLLEGDAPLGLAEGAMPVFPPLELPAEPEPGLPSPVGAGEPPPAAEFTSSQETPEGRMLSQLPEPVPVGSERPLGSETGGIDKELSIELTSLMAAAAGLLT